MANFHRGDGPISDEEWDEYAKQSEKLCQDTVDTSNQAGVVAALILGAAFPYILEPPEFDEERWHMLSASSLTGLDWALRALCLTCINVTVGASVCAVGVSSMITSQLIKRSRCRPLRQRSDGK